MNISEKAELTALVHHIERFSKSGIPIYNSEALQAASRKTRRGRTQATAKRYAFHANYFMALAFCNKATNFHYNNK